LGSIRPGALADILALKANPLEDVAALRQVAMVMKDGKVVYRAE
jgi:imidazolonepropionase-like amidohydrolase